MDPSQGEVQSFQCHVGRVKLDYSARQGEKIVVFLHHCCWDHSGRLEKGRDSLD